MIHVKVKNSSYENIFNDEWSIQNILTHLNSEIRKRYQRNSGLTHQKVDVIAAIFRWPDADYKLRQQGFTQRNDQFTHKVINLQEVEPRVLTVDDLIINSKDTNLYQHNVREVAVNVQSA